MSAIVTDAWQEAGIDCSTLDKRRATKYTHADHIKNTMNEEEVWAYWCDNCSMHLVEEHDEAWFPSCKNCEELITNRGHVHPELIEVRIDVDSSIAAV